MKVVIDDKIPYIAEMAKRLFDETVFLPGAEFGKSGEVKDADALIVRTRTLCDRTLLEGSSVKFIATATIGFDHINLGDLEALGIRWTNCPGCNAASVGQYVRNCLALSSMFDGKAMSDYTVGIVGYGHVGREVYKSLRSAGCKLLVNDPPLAEQGGVEIELVDFGVLAEECDVVTFHTPLIKDGAHPSYHLADSDFFEQLKHKPIIINAARGGVVDEHAMMRAYAKGLIGRMIVDTWENEPRIDPALLNSATIATPHIAGYSADGKSNATRMSLKAVCEFFDIALDEQEFLSLTSAPSLPLDMVPTGNEMVDWLRLYNPLDDTLRLKGRPDAFEWLRGNYPLRRESF